MTGGAVWNCLRILHRIRAESMSMGLPCTTSSSVIARPTDHVGPPMVKNDATVVPLAPVA